MKKGVLFMSLLVSSLFGFQAVAQEIIEGPAISVDKDVNDYGDLEFAANGECEFIVTNTGTEPLLLTGARGSCGCTVPTYPKEPISPGASAAIKVTYDTKRVGNFSKTVTITSNAVNEPTKTVSIKGKVAPQPEGAAPVAPATGPAVNTAPVSPNTTVSPAARTSTSSKSTATPKAATSKATPVAPRK